MARGAATRLHAEGKILDYSGRPLNLASRLMDFARPSGVVTDASFGIELLEDQLSEQFASQEVYIKSLAESSPASIQYTLNRTVIPSASTRPIQKIEWQEDHKNKTAKEIGQSRTFVHFLTKTPSDPDLIRVRYDFPAATKSGKRRGHIRTMEYVTKSTYSDEFGVPSVTISYAEISDALSRHAVKSTWDVNIYIRYPVK